jgi:hypothetical protein
MRVLNPVMCQTTIKLDVPDEELERMMGRKGLIDGPTCRAIKDELQAVLFDLTDEDGLTLEITYRMGNEDKDHGYLTFEAILRYPLVLLDKMDIESYALEMFREKGLPSGLKFYGAETTNDLDD